MKTAMQELRDDMAKIFHDNKIPLYLDIAKYLEKEKGQIEIAFDLGRDEVTSEFIIDGEDYYNKKFNQNK
jgi:hypothetical protein